MGLKHLQVAVWAVCLFSAAFTAVETSGEPPPGQDGDRPIEEVTVTEDRVTVIRNGRAITIDCADPRLAWLCSNLTTFQPWWWDYYAEGYGFMESGGYDERNEAEDLGSCESLSNKLLLVGTSLMAVNELAKGTRAAYKWYNGDRSAVFEFGLENSFSDHFDVANSTSVIWMPPPPAGFRMQRGILVPQSSWSRSQGAGARSRLDIVFLVTGTTGAVVFLSGVGTAVYCSFTPNADE